MGFLNWVPFLSNKKKDSWQKKLLKLEKAKKWDAAIEFMQHIIQKIPNDLNAYLHMNYLIMNLLVEEDYDENKHEYYATLLKQYFQKSYKKFSNNPEYLFFTGLTAFMSEWYFDIEIEDARKMLYNATILDPSNAFYIWGYLAYSHMGHTTNNLVILDYAKRALDNKLIIKKIISTKGSLGEYLLDIMNNWIKRIESQNMNTNND